MTPEELQSYLHNHIPLSAAMQVRVDAVSDDHVLLSAPLAPNINHRDTVFGGSASALAILSAWSLLHVRMRKSGVVARLVIQSNRMDYLKPVAGAFAARSSLAGRAMAGLSAIARTSGQGARRGRCRPPRRRHLGRSLRGRVCRPWLRQRLTSASARRLIPSGSSGSRCGAR
jgi:thioesterase domain-containing protein